MGRPSKQTVDYFPHYCRHGKTLMILEQKYGNDGYAFWFKLLEMLGDSDGHYIDMNDMISWEFLQSKTRLTEDICREILNLLARLKAIDTDYWENIKVVWCANFVANVSDAYRNRVVETPKEPDFLRQIYLKTDSFLRQKGVRNPHSRVEESRVDNNPPLSPPKGGNDNGVRKTKKPKPVPLPQNFTVSPEVIAWAKAKGHTHLEAHLEAFVEYARSNGKTYVDWDCAFKRCVRENWGRIDYSKPDTFKPIRKVCPKCGAWEDKCQCKVLGLKDSPPQN